MTKKLDASSLEDIIDIDIPKVAVAPAPQNTITPNPPLTISGGGMIGNHVHYSPQINIGGHGQSIQQSNPFEFSFDDYVTMPLKELQEAKNLLKDKINDIDVMIADASVSDEDKKEVKLTRLILKYILLDITRMGK